MPAEIMSNLYAYKVDNDRWDEISWCFLMLLKLGVFARMNTRRRSIFFGGYVDVELFIGTQGEH